MIYAGQLRPLTPPDGSIKVGFDEAGNARVEVNTGNNGAPPTQDKILALFQKRSGALIDELAFLQVWLKTAMSGDGGGGGRIVIPKMRVPPGLGRVG